MHILHSGTKHSFRARLDSETKKRITLIDALQKEITITSEIKIDWFAPSLEGEVLICYYTNGFYDFYCTKTGQRLHEDIVREMEQCFFT